MTVSLIHFTVCFLHPHSFEVKIRDFFLCAISDSMHSLNMSTLAPFYPLRHSYPSSLLFDPFLS